MLLADTLICFNLYGCARMHLMYTLDASGKRVYTLKKIQGGQVTKSAHPARFSPDDKYSRYAYVLISGDVKFGVIVRRLLAHMNFAIGIELR